MKNKRGLIGSFFFAVGFSGFLQAADTMVTPDTGTVVGTNVSSRTSPKPKSIEEFMEERKSQNASTNLPVMSYPVHSGFDHVSTQPKVVPIKVGYPKAGDKDTQK